MAYFKINGTDFSHYVNKLKIGLQHKYSSTDTASGKVSAKYRDSSYIVEVGIIPLDADAMKSLQTYISQFALQISFLDPTTEELKDIDCILTNSTVDYYTIQEGNTKFKAFSLTFTEARITSPLS